MYRMLIFKTLKFEGYGLCVGGFGRNILHILRSRYCKIILRNSELEKIKLEFDYLSSSDKLLEFQSLYFENDLVQKKIENIKVFKITNKDKEIKNLKIIRE